MARHARIVLVTLLAAGLLAFFLRNADLRRVAHELGNARWDLLAGGGALSGVVYLLRAERWRRLLRPIAPVSFRAALRATVVGFAANALFPGRVGELLRPYALARRERLSAAAVLATIVIERLLDLLAICLLFSVLAPFAGPRAPAGGADLLGVLKTTALVAGLGACAAFAVMLGAAAAPERARRAAERLASRAPRGAAERLGATVRHFLGAVTATRRPRPLGTALAWSLAVWATVAASLWCVTEAFGIDVRPADAAVLTTLAVVGMAVPTPAGIGGYHAAYQLGATALYGASGDRVVGAALVLHLLWFGPVAAAGLVLMGRDGVRTAAQLSRRGPPARAQQPVPHRS